MSDKINLTEEEKKKINTICDYLFFDQFTEMATYLRFERCFQPLLTNDKDTDIEDLFKEICGPKKKYLNYKRFVKSYLNYKENKVSKELKEFFDKLFNSILKEEKVGEFEGGKLTYSTMKANKNRDCITSIEVLNDKEQIIHGVNVIFDEIFENKLYPKKLEETLSVGLELNLRILDENRLEKRKLPKNIKDSYFRDVVTHVFGTVDEKTNYITFLGFKCISGKTQFVGTPKGKSFLIGEFGKKLNQLKCQMTMDGITCLLPYLDKNLRPNVYLSKKISELTLEDINKDEIILDEKYLSKLTDEEEIDKYITTPLIDDAHFFNFNLKDDIFGNSLKEVIKKQPKRWMRNRIEREKMIPRPRRFLSLNDFMLKYNEEHRRRGRYYFAPRFGLLDPRRMHRRRRLHFGYGYGFGGFPHGPFHRHFSPFGPRPPFGRFGPMPPSMRAFSTPHFGNIMPHYPHFMSYGPHFPYRFSQEQFYQYPSAYMSYDPRFPYSQTKYYERLDNRYDNYEDLIGEKQKKENDKLKAGQNKKLKAKKGNQGYVDDYYKNYYDDYDLNMAYDYPSYQYSNINYNPNIKIIKSKIRAKYLRKDILQSYNYMTPQSEIYRPIPKRIEIDAQEEYEPDQQVFDQQVLEQEQEQIQAQQEEQEQIQAQYEAQEQQEIQTPEEEEAQIQQQNAEQEQQQYAEQEPVQEQEQIQAQYEVAQQEEPKEEIQEVIAQQTQGEIIEGNVEEPKAGDEEKANNDNDDDEDILIPDEHPEETTTLEELDEQLESLKKLLGDENIKEEEKKKLLQLQKLYTQQKNILLDNAEEKEKAEMMNKSDIKIENYIKEEKEKREKEEEDIEKIIEKEIDENTDKTEAKIISITTARNPSKIFRNQEMYTGANPWTDPMFVPCKDNLCPSDKKGWILPENVLFTDVMGWEKYNWCRVEDILNSKNYQVFEDGISPDDIIQGSIGDCYFLSAVGSLCKFSHYIDRLFLTKERTKEHLYGVFIYLNATWKLVIIDDFLPYTGKKFRKFAFSSSGGKELWVALLEKAWAKINGNYAKIGCGGSPTEIFDVLTEAYTEQVQINPYYKDYIWETMINAEQKGYIMTAGTSSDIANLNLDEVGLSPGHAYTVLGVLEIDTEKGKEKVVHLRNPYGNGEFNGDWSDYSKKWTPELKKKYNLVIKDDGDFYMAFDDFLNYYITLGVCKLHPGYKTTTLKIKDPTQCQITKVTVTQDEVHAFLQIYQKNPRVPLKDGTKPKLVYNFLMLVDENFNYIYSVSNKNMHNGIEQNLKAGTYYLLSDVNYRYSNPNKKNYSYVITCYSKVALNLENVTSNFDVTNAIQTAIYSYCRMYIPPTKCSNGVFLYRGATNMDSIPFETAVFENYTDKDYKVKLNVVGKGEKSFCFYEDEIATENDITTIKELPKNSVAIFTVLKYGVSSIFNFKYFFAPLKSPNPNNPTALRAPKIYDEPPKLGEPQATTDANAQQAQSQAQAQIPEQNQNTQSNQEVNIEHKKEVAPKEIQENKEENIQASAQNEINKVEDKQKESQKVAEQPKENIQEIQKEEKIENEKNILPPQTQVKVVKKKGGHPVFQTEGQILDEDGALVQYYMETGDEIVIGLENRSNMKIKMQLEIQGAIIVNSGKSVALFYSNPRERKIFRAKKINNFNDQVVFQFLYA